MLFRDWILEGYYKANGGSRAALRTGKLTLFHLILVGGVERDLGNFRLLASEGHDVTEREFDAFEQRRLGRVACSKKDEMRRKVETVDNVEDNYFDNPTVVFVFVFVNRFHNDDGNILKNISTP